MNGTIGKWMRPLSLALAVASLAFTPLQAARVDCSTPVSLTVRSYDDDDLRAVGEKTYTKGGKIECDGDLMFFYEERPMVFRLNKFGEIEAGKNVVFELQNDLGFDTASFADGPVQTSKVQFNFVVDGTTYFLAFRNDPDFPASAGSDNIWVTRVVTDDGEETWEIEASPTDKAQLLILTGKGKNQKYEAVGEAEEFPFKITVRKK